MNISAHITLSEATFSQNAVDNKIDNTPTAEHLEAMEYVAENIFERVRTHFGKPIRINSFFRSGSLNKAVGGAITSQHCKGEAIDVTGLPYGTKNSEIFHYIKDNLDFDQLIWEFGDKKEPSWVHFSYNLRGNKRKCLRAVKDHNGKTIYQNFV
jgi:zinc D-Ala-D-Ala carboxypeptidase